MMALVLVLLLILTISTVSTKGQSIPPTIILGNGHSASDKSCPSEELRELSRQTVSTTVQRMISDIYQPIYSNCKAALESGQNTSGIYKVQPDHLDPFHVYCDMETDGGGWTVFQRRQDGSEDFYRVWNDYVSGFGNLNGEFWLGLEKIHRLTNRVVTTLRVDMGDFEGNTAFAQYATFRVLNSSTNYILNVAGYSGNAGDALSIRHSGQPFTTKDRDNDLNGNNCVVAFSGAWWYGNCHHSNLNGLYHTGSHSSFADGMNWYQWKGYNYSLRFSEMKLR